MSWPDRIPLATVLKTSVVLPQAFYERAPEVVARALLGKAIVHEGTAGRIVETEAYLGMNDMAAHAWRGITGRTRVLFGPPGHAYIYLIYGIYECLNFVAEPEGQAGCVLIRALEPLTGIETMRSRRPAARKPQQLCSGPGKLTLAMGITRALNGAPITRGRLTVREMPAVETFEITVSPRIGVTECADWPLRFFIAGNPCVSRAPAAGRKAPTR